MENKSKKALLLGDYSNPKYHPLTEIDKEIESIFKDNFSLTCTEDYNILSSEHFKDYDLCILYVDCWGKIVGKTLTHNLLDFIKNGGGLLIIHNGISLDSNKEYAEMVGAKFLGHPAYTKLTVKSTGNNDYIMNGISEFEIEDEPYHYEMFDYAEKSIFMIYYHEGNTYPAGWTRQIGNGKLVYIMPGHDIKSFKNDTYRKIILRSALWTFFQGHARPLLGLS
ncbi:MAG: ThuA domain-containing protein [Nitrososphaeria archaeon]|jgi:type 1 glutamine amidotransferase